MGSELYLLFTKLAQSHVLQYTTTMDYDILPPTNDFVFKLLFGDDRHKSMLIDMLKSFVNLPEEDFELVFLDTYLKPEHEEDKMGILDIKVSTKTGKIIDWGLGTRDRGLGFWYESVA